MDINHDSASGNGVTEAGGMFLTAEPRAWKGPLVFQIDDDMTQNPVKDYSFDDRLQATVAEKRKQLFESAMLVKQDSNAEEHRNIRTEMIQSIFQSDMQLFHAVKMAELAKQNEYIRLRKVEERILTPAQLEASEAAKLQLEAKTKRCDYATASHVLAKGWSSTTDATAARQRFIRQLFELRKHWRLVRVPGDRDSREMLAVDCSGRATARTFTTASMHRLDEDLVVVRPCEQGIDYEPTIPRRLYSLQLSLETDSGEVLQTAQSLPAVVPPNGVTSDVVLQLHEYCTRTRHSQICRRIFERIMTDLRNAEKTDAAFRLAPTGSRVHVHTDESVAAAASSTAMYFSGPQVVQKLPNVVRLRVASNRILCIQSKFADAEPAAPHRGMLSRLLLLLVEWISRPPKPADTTLHPTLIEVDDGNQKAAAPMVFHLCWAAQFHLRVQEIEQSFQRVCATASEWGLPMEIRRGATSTLFPTTSAWTWRIGAAEMTDLVKITLDGQRIEARVLLAQSASSSKAANRQIATQQQLDALCEGVLATVLTRQICNTISEATDSVQLRAHLNLPSNVHSIEISRGAAPPHLLMTLAFQQNTFQASVSRFDISDLQPQTRLLSIEIDATSLGDAVNSIVTVLRS